ncbi:MAG TPA: UDP-glucose 4-epimerase GalE [Bacillota bacterium]|nr:UDP-glucose 4-epimerase GalE [Bacillota bacterium]
MNILVTGGAGYIGSHTVVELLAAGHAVKVLDNFCNSSLTALERVAKICGREIPFYEADISDGAVLDAIFEKNDFDCCIHFAGLKAVGESVLKPWEYYENNVAGTLTLLESMRSHGCKNIVFSSSATVYGAPDAVPVTEGSVRGFCANPYGRTKAIIEDILTDMYAADLKTGENRPWNVVLLRYFNPIGAHPSGLIGEAPDGIPANLMPYITQVAAGKLNYLRIFGYDYDTPDGTGIRDYIHVVDLAKGHVSALKAIEKACGLAVYNLGTGRGCSVMELLKTFKDVNGVDVPYVIAPRRDGDIAVSYADPSKAERELGWKAELGIEDMCRDSWRWQKNNPDGFK